MGTDRDTGRGEVKISLLARCCAAALGCSSRSPSRAGAGSELYAVAPDSVTDIVFTSASRKVFAYRFQAGQPMVVVTADVKAAAPETCSGGPEFQRWFETLSQMRVASHVNKPVDALDPGWATVMLRDATVLEPVLVRVLVVGGPKPSVIAEYAGQRYVVATDAAALDSSRLSCATLGR